MSKSIFEHIEYIQERESYILSREDSKGSGISEVTRGNTVRRCVQEGETQDNTGSTGSEHGNMHRFGEGKIHENTIL